MSRKRPIKRMKRKNYHFQEKKIKILSTRTKQKFQFPTRLLNQELKASKFTISIRKTQHFLIKMMFLGLAGSLFRHQCYKALCHWRFDQKYARMFVHDRCFKIDNRKEPTDILVDFISTQTNLKIHTRNKHPSLFCQSINDTKTQFYAQQQCVNDSFNKPAIF